MMTVGIGRYDRTTDQCVGHTNCARTLPRDTFKRGTKMDVKTFENSKRPYGLPVVVSP